MRNPTARLAEKATAAHGLTDTVSINGQDPIKISRDTARAIVDLLDIQYSPSTGELFATIKENAPASVAPENEGDITRKAMP